MIFSRAAFLVLAAALPGAAVGCFSGSHNTGQEEKENEALARPRNEVRAHLKPWHPFREKWATDAKTIITATYQEDSYPCIFHSDGSIAMPLCSTFKKEEVIKGEVACPSFDANVAGLGEPCFPHDFVTDRTYLVFLKPAGDSLKRLKKAKTEFTRDTRLKSDELVAIIDLSQSKREADALKVQATRTKKHKGFTFTPEKWTALRDAETVDLDLQKRFQSFIEEVVAPPRATLQHVRSYLGQPDYWHHYSSSDVFYEYALNRGAKKRKGMITGFLELTFSSDLKLSKYRISFLRCLEDDRSAWEELPAPDLKRLRLRNVDR